MWCPLYIVIKVGQGSGDRPRYKSSPAAGVSGHRKGLILLSGISYREKSPAGKVTGRGQSSGGG